MLHHRKRTKIAFITSLLGIAVLGMATNAFLREKTAQNSDASDSVADQPAPQTTSDTVKSTTTPDQQTETNTAASVQQESAAQPTESQQSVDGVAVTYPNGPSLIVPTPWLYSFSTENGVATLNFGTQNFSRDNPYAATMRADAFGYIVPEESAPTEAIGALLDEQTVTTKSGEAVVIRRYSTLVGDATLVQAVATFTSGTSHYTAIFYTDIGNDNQLVLFTTLIASVS